MASIEVSFDPLRDADADALAEWIAADVWPYHGTARPTAGQVRDWIAHGRFTGDESRSFWIRAPGEPRAGLIAIQELSDVTPIFDLRIRSAYRRRGLGREALDWLAGHVFSTTDRHRIEGHTRADNEPMRRLFGAMGWVLEAHYRQAWPAEGGGYHDAVSYALLRADWASGARTSVPGGP